ncbi:ice-binding family protein [Micromonospora vulcania]|uniref:Ice-binding family protein n=1 Tax=Micromonospora vulcania TaxID=1441873 RepID=A0ABW1H3F2_9ACTN
MAVISPVAVRPRVTAIRRLATALVLVSAATVVVEVAAPTVARAETVQVPLGSAADYAVLAGTTVTNTGLSMITGDLGVSPGTAVTGFPPGQIDGAIHSNDGPAVQAKSDLAVGYNNAVARTTTDIISGGLGGTTRTTGVYSSVSGTFGIDGTLTLDGQGDPNAVFIFKAVSTLITSADSQVNLINGAQACNVFWQVGSSATLGANSTLRGDILAFTSITVGAGLTIDGRALAVNGAVTLDTDVITLSTCVPGELSITAPETVDLGTTTPGGTVSDNLGTVTVTDQRRVADAAWIATVVASDFVTTGSPVRTIASVNVSYWSGPATSTSGSGTFTSGQPTAGDAQTLNLSRTAFTLTGGDGVNSATWDPVVSVHVPFTSVVGQYTGTLTFSVA